MIRHKFLHPKALAAGLALAAASVALAARSQGHEGGNRLRAGEATTVEQQQAVGPSPGEQRRPRVSVRLPAGAQLGRSAQREIARAARRFGTSLASWLYGDRRAIKVEPVAPRVRRELASAPPHVPRDQIGSGGGQAVRVQVFLQTSRSGVLAVTIRDSRTSYAIPASLERRVGRWEIVHLNTH